MLISSRSNFSRILLAFAALVLLAAAPACKRNVITKHEYMYVSALETSLRDRVATMYNKVGTVHNGDRVEVLERYRRFLRVRTDSGLEGWVEQRSLVSQDVFDGFQKLAQDAAGLAVQGHGTTRAELNMHITPSRDGEHLYQLKDAEKVEILKRATTDKNAPKTPPPPKPEAPPQTQAGGTEEKPSASTPPAGRTGASPAQPASSTKRGAAPVVISTAKTSAITDKTKEPEPPKPVMEDWYLVRNSAGQVGWVLMRMVDLDVPLDVAQYAEGQRIVGYFVLNTVQETIDGQPKEEPQYLMLLNQPKDGLPYDYNQIRVFTRNRNKHRYETAYRERDIEGYLPARTGHAVFDKEGDLPTFTIRKMNDSGQIVEVTYKMNGPIVRRVLTPEELAEQKARHDAELAARQKARADARAQKSAATRKKKHH
ncbi:MAG TPA: SH3 domain-containing protein [Candidatus Eisenbacteria bacterium]|nr:SH3 domain-containing protein [Candidatus Eisenbacteria bacterium]